MNIKHVHSPFHQFKHKLSHIRTLVTVVTSIVVVQVVGHWTTTKGGKANKQQLQPPSLDR